MNITKSKSDKIKTGILNSSIALGYFLEWYYIGCFMPLSKGIFASIDFLKSYSDYAYVLSLCPSFFRFIGSVLFSKYGDSIGRLQVILVGPLLLFLLNLGVIISFILHSFHWIFFISLWIMYSICVGVESGVTQIYFFEKSNKKPTFQVGILYLLAGLGFPLGGLITNYQVSLDISQIDVFRNLILFSTPLVVMCVCMRFLSRSKEIEINAKKKAETVFRNKNYSSISKKFFIYVRTCSLIFPHALCMSFVYTFLYNHISSIDTFLKKYYFILPIVITTKLFLLPFVGYFADRHNKYKIYLYACFLNASLIPLLMLNHTLIFYAIVLSTAFITPTAISIAIESLTVSSRCQIYGNSYNFTLGLLPIVITSLCQFLKNSFSFNHTLYFMTGLLVFVLIHNFFFLRKKLNFKPIDAIQLAEL